MGLDSMNTYNVGIFTSWRVPFRVEPASLASSIRSRYVHGHAMVDLLEMHNLFHGRAVLIYTQKQNYAR